MVVGEWQVLVIIVWQKITGWRSTHAFPCGSCISHPQVQIEKNATRLEAMEKELRVSGFIGRSVVVGCLAIGVAVLAFGGSPEVTPKFDENKEFGSMTKELKDRDNDIATRDKASLDLAVSTMLSGAKHFATLHQEKFRWHQIPIRKRTPHPKTLANLVGVPIW